MSTRRGMDGSFSYSGSPVLATEGWEYTAKADQMEASVQGDSWKEHVPGLAEWSGKVNLRFDLADSGQLALHNALLVATPGTSAVAVIFRMFAGAGGGVTGTAFVEDFNASAPVNGIVKAVVTLRGTGALIPTVS